MIDIFIPSYHRPDNLKTVNFFLKKGYDKNLIHVFIDDATDDIEEYQRRAEKDGFNLHIFEMKEARERFDYVHRASESRRSAGQARNMFYDIAESLGIDFYMVMDDDTANFQTRPFAKYLYMSTYEEIVDTFVGIKDFMQRRRIGCFGLSQNGDMFVKGEKRILRKKVMNTTFIDTRFMYRGERGVQDNDTSQFVGIMNEGYFTGSLATGLVLQQTPSATATGGLTELYNECKLLNKSLIIPIQFPSCSYAEKQKRNGGRIYHKIRYRYLQPYLMKGKRSNIAWDIYQEDGKFTNEPKR